MTTNNQTSTLSDSECYDEQLQQTGIGTSREATTQFIAWAKLNGLKVITEIDREVTVTNGGSSNGR